MLEYCIEHQTSDPYGTYTSFKTCTHKKFFTKLYKQTRLSKGIPDDYYFSIKCRIHKSRVPFLGKWFDRWLMMLDCDSFDGMIAAKAMLHYDKIGHATVQSSQHHYWLITDYVGSLQNVLDKMQSIPGCDSNYHQWSMNHKKIMIRGMPRTPNEIFFIDEHSLKNQDVLHWYTEYRNHIQSTEFDRYFEYSKLTKALYNEEMTDLISNPSFEIE